MRYDVETEALRGGADALASVLWRLDRLGLPEDLGRVGSALVGGRTATATSQICLAWQARLSETRWQLRGVGSQLTTAADSYEVVEEVARKALAPREAPASSPSRRR
jgi:hypothetical protein